MHKQHNQATITTTHALVIGGLIFNQQPLQAVLELFMHAQFIDINQANYVVLRDQIQTLIVSQPTQHFTLIGYSSGGLLAIELAACLQHKHQLSLVLLNSSPYFMAANNWQGISRPHWRNLMNKFNNLSLAKFCEFFISLAYYPQSIQPQLRSQLVSPHCQTQIVTHWLETLCSLDLRAQWLALNIKCLILNAELDSIVVANPWPELKPSVLSISLAGATHAQFALPQLLHQIATFITRYE